MFNVDLVKVPMNKSNLCLYCCIVLGRLITPSFPGQPKLSIFTGDGLVLINESKCNDITTCNLCCGILRKAPKIS